MKKRIRTLLTAVLAAMMTAAFGMNLMASAEEHYDVYNYDRWNEAIPSQAGYLANRSGRENFVLCQV